jgi:hypothetical protein
MAGVTGSEAADDRAPHEVRQVADGIIHQQTDAEPGPRASVAGQDAEAKQHDAAEVAKELVADLRAELPRIDARAAAGVALTAAVLVSVVNQAPVAMPIYAVAVAAAVLLTIALLLFLMVLLPTPTLPPTSLLGPAKPG